jgi:hypothetical protein
MTNEQPEALRLADWLDDFPRRWDQLDKAAAELRRLHELHVLYQDKVHRLEDAVKSERDRIWTQTHWTEHERSIAAAEREACAKLCDEIAIDMWKLYKGRPPYKGDEEGRASHFTQGRSAGADDCAEAIRARSKA